MCVSVLWTVAFPASNRFPVFSTAQPLGNHTDGQQVYFSCLCDSDQAQWVLESLCKLPVSQSSAPQSIPLTPSPNILQSFSPSSHILHDSPHFLLPPWLQGACSVLQTVPGVNRKVPSCLQILPRERACLETDLSSISTCLEMKSHSGTSPTCPEDPILSSIPSSPLPSPQLSLFLSAGRWVTPLRDLGVVLCDSCLPLWTPGLKSMVEGRVVCTRE